MEESAPSEFRVIQNRLPNACTTLQFAIPVLKATKKHGLVLNDIMTFADKPLCLIIHVRRASSCPY